MTHPIKLMVIILLLALISCKHNSREITKEFSESTIKATLVDRKFNGPVIQTFHETNNGIKSIYTKWETGDIKEIVLIDSIGVKHNMRYQEEKGKNENEVTIFYKDMNDATFKTIPFNVDFLEFCEENAFLSENSLSSFGTKIKIYNIPHNSFRAMSSPLPIKIENNTITVINNGYETDTLLITLVYWIRKSETKFKIGIKKGI